MGQLMSHLLQVTQGLARNVQTIPAKVDNLREHIDPRDQLYYQGESWDLPVPRAPVIVHWFTPAHHMTGASGAPGAGCPGPRWPWPVSRPAPARLRDLRRGCYTCALQVLQSEWVQLLWLPDIQDESTQMDTD